MNTIAINHPATEAWTEEVTTYEYSELDYSAQQHAFEEWAWKQDYLFCDDEYKACLEAIKKYMGVSAGNWSVDGLAHYDYDFNLDCDDPFDEDASWVRISKYVNTNIMPILHRCDKKNIDSCLTGMYTDYSFLRLIIECANYKVKYNNLTDLYQDAMDEFFSAWVKDRQYEVSEDGFKDYCDCNDIQFDEDGNMI